MKKALIVLLILAIAGGMFAQEIVWNGEVNTGIRFDFKDDSPVKGDDDDGTAIRANLGAAYDADDWGLKIQGGARNNVDYVFSLSNAYGWMYFANHALKVSAGKIDDGVWSTFGAYDTGLATGPGIRLEVLPIDGLNIGAFFTYPDTPDGVSAAKVGNWFQQTAFGAEYAADAFKVSTTFRLYSEEDTFTTTADTDAHWIFSVGIYALPIVDIIFDGGIKHLMKMSDVGEEVFAEKFIFKGLPLGLTLILKETFAKSFEFSEFYAEVNADYGFTDSVSFGVDGNMTMAKDASDSMGFAGWGFDAWAKYTLGGSFVKGVFGIDGTTEKYSADGKSSTDPYLRILFGYAW